MAAGDAGRRRTAPRGVGQARVSLGFGVGIADGFATAGRIGAEGRYDYAAIGNAVILAARLSGQGRARPDPDGRSARTPSSRARSRRWRSTGWQLKGVSHPVTAWNIVGLRDAD